MVRCGTWWLSVSRGLIWFHITQNPVDERALISLRSHSPTTKMTGSDCIVPLEIESERLRREWDRERGREGDRKREYREKEQDSNLARGRMTERQREWESDRKRVRENKTQEGRGREGGIRKMEKRRREKNTQISSSLESYPPSRLSALFWLDTLLASANAFCKWNHEHPIICCCNAFYFSARLCPTPSVRLFVSKENV